MTRKDFEAIASALHMARPGEHWDANKRVQWNMDCKAMAGVGKRSNARFKPDVFYKACGGLFDV